MKNLIVILTVCFVSVIVNAADDWDIYEDETINDNTYDQINIYANAVLGVYGNQSLISWTRNYDNSKINLFDGYISTLHQYDTSTINVFGGETGSWEMWGQSIAHLHGGDIEFIMLYELSNQVHFYGYDFSYIRSGGQQEAGWLSGKWEDGEAFNIYLRYLPGPFPENPYEEDSFIVLHEVPEPTTFILSTIGLIMIKRNRKPVS